jgi:uncharacterized repeat protein (TIGR01451 family)
MYRIKIFEEEIMKKLIFITMMLIVMYSVSLAQPLAEPDVKMEMEAKKVIIEEKVVDDEKVKDETFVPAEEAFPNDIVQYELRYWNEGDGAANNLSIVGPIPYNTVYIPQSAVETENTEIKFSIDRFFKITEETISKLKEQALPNSVINPLEGLKDREYDSEKAFVDVLKATLEEEMVTQYKDLILNYSVDKSNPKTYHTPPIKYTVKEVDENGVEKEVEKIATPDMYTSIQWNLQDEFKPAEELTLSYRVTIR